MRGQQSSSSIGSSLAEGGIGYGDAESIFRWKPISEIRKVEVTAKKQIQDKKEDLRQLIGNRYRDLIDSADSIVRMKSSCESISANISAINDGIRSLASSPLSETPKLASPNPVRLRLYGIACRVKYLVDTPENIWGCLDESMFLEAASRYVRAKHVLESLGSSPDNALSNFPLVQHQWQIVESFKAQISQRSRDRLLDQGLGIGAYADALAAVAIIDELNPEQVLALFLDSRKSWISQRLVTCSANPTCSSAVVSVFCDVMRIIQLSIGHVGELFLQVLNDFPLYYKVILCSPPASQLFGGIPNPDEEVRLWKLFRDRLESVMVMLDGEFIAKTCSDWLRACGEETVGEINGKHLIDAIGSSQELALAEKSIRETMDSKVLLQGCLEWLKSVFGSEIELPWSRIREVVLKYDADLWDEFFEGVFVRRAKVIIDLRFEDLTNDVSIKDSIRAIGETHLDQIDFLMYSSRFSNGGAVWFTEPNNKNTRPISVLKVSSEETDFWSCPETYFGPEVSRIRDAVDSCCQSILEDMLHFLESPKAALRLIDLAPYLQNRCYDSMSSILMGLRNEVEYLNTALYNGDKDGKSLPPAIIVSRSLLIGRFLFAFQKHSRHIPVILGPPRFWVKENVGLDKPPALFRHSRVCIDSTVCDSPKRQTFSSFKSQTSLAASALLGADDSASPKLEELSNVTRDLCIRAHSLWVSWVSDELSVVLSRDLRQDDGLSSMAPLKCWEDKVVKLKQSKEGPSEMKISLPSIPSLYVTSFLFRACEEIRLAGVHVLDKTILQKFTLRLLEKAFGIYEVFLSTKDVPGPQVSEKGILQLLFDVKFVADVLSGGDPTMNENSLKSPMSITRDRVNGLMNRLSQTLDPIDWLTYERHFWKKVRQSYLRHAVLFGFFVQLNRMYRDIKQKSPKNQEANIMRCSNVPRFKYLPISAPALSSRGTAKKSPSTSLDDISSRSTWKSCSNGELSPWIDFDESSGFGVATPFLKSFMQVGSRFGESTLKLGSILTDAQVGKFKDKSAAAMSTFGDILPAQAAGLLSSFTATRSDS